MVLHRTSDRSLVLVRNGAIQLHNSSGMSRQIIFIYGNKEMFDLFLLFRVMDSHTKGLYLFWGQKIFGADIKSAYAQ